MGTNNVERRRLKVLMNGKKILLLRYPDPEAIATEKSTEEYRNYDAPPRDTVKEFYRLNHTYQTYDFVQEKRNNYLKFDKKEMPVWEAFDFLNQLVDDSDPDTDLDQFQHLLQTSEAIRRDGHPDWMVLVGLMHDMGKVLCLLEKRNGQWWAIHSPWDVLIQIKLYSLNFSKTIPIITTLSTIQNTGYTKKVAASAMWI